MATEISIEDSTLKPLLDKSQNIQIEQILPWKQQLTLRGLLISAVLGTLFSLMVHRLNLTVGVVPSLGAPAALLAFYIIRLWNQVTSKLRLPVSPLTRQENTVIQTCIVACFGVAYSGGFGTNLPAMDEKTYRLVGVDYPGNRAEDVINPSLGWMIGFLTFISFLGVFCLVPLRKFMVMNDRLSYPSGTATAMLINGFHTTVGTELAGEQTWCLGKCLSISFCWSCFKWFFSGTGGECGFDNFPIFGWTLYEKTFFFDFSLSSIGCALVCPHLVNSSMLLGAIMSWGLLFPFLSKHAGNWYPTGLGTRDLKGIGGYEAFIATSLIFGDGLYNLVKVSATLIGERLHTCGTEQTSIPVKEDFGARGENSTFLMEQGKRDKIFLKEEIPFWFAASGYVILAVTSSIMIPGFFPSLNWYLVLFLYIIAPALAFCNSYGAGLTDIGLASIYGKIGVFSVGSFVGSSNGGVIAGLAACGILSSSVSAAADLMQDFKTGHLTLTSSKSMFVSQLIGTAMGCVIAPLTFWLFWTCFDLGSPDGLYKVPYAIIYREMAIVGVEGFTELPKYCLWFATGSLFLALALNLMRDVTPRKISQYIPIPTAMAIPCFVGSHFAIDMFLGTMVRFVWEKMNQESARKYTVAVAAGFMCGDGLWTLPSAILSVLKVDPPICMSFLPSISTKQ